MNWIDLSAVINLDELVIDQAQRVATYVLNNPEIATFVEARRHLSGADLLVLDIQTGVPQRTTVPIERVERICALFPAAEATPIVLVLRTDFPDTEHQLLVPDGCPCGLCIDDRPWDEARLTWTPAEFLQRICLWFRRAARGQLHDPRQPLDPFFGLSPFRVVVPACALANLEGVELDGFCPAAQDPDLIITVPAGLLPGDATAPRPLLVGYSVPPERMSRMRKAPRNLAGLAHVLSERGVDIVADLCARLRHWVASETKVRPRLRGKLAIVLSMPVVAADGNLPGLIDIRMFVTARSVGQIGVALGVLEPGPVEDTASGYVLAIPRGEANFEALAGIYLEMAQVHRAFDPDWAATLAGRDKRDARKVVLVGAGAIGSHVAECLTREGRFEWTVVDDDRLLPHNLARHTLGSMQNGQPKAEALRKHLNAIFAYAGEVPVTGSIECNVLRPGDKIDELRDAITAAEIVIDASASVATARCLSDFDASARRASIFFNPSAEAVVALVESADRSLTLRDLEAQYYRAVLQRSELRNHLTTVGERFAYSGACREVTNRVPESRIACLSALAASGLSHALSSPGPMIRIWTIGPDGDVAVSTPVAATASRHNLASWEVSIDAGVRAQMNTMREDALPRETGGSVLGVVDTFARKIHVVEALPEPPDSQGSLTRFERGVGSLSEDVSGKLARVMDQVRYVGEWHSHPRDNAIAPSTTDVAQLCETTLLAAIESQPGLSLIVGDGRVNVLMGLLQL